MNNKEKYVEAFAQIFQVDKEEVGNLEYQSITAWDSVGHMSLMAELEDAFDIMMDTDDIIDFSTFKKGIGILEKYDVEF